MSDAQLAARAANAAIQKLTRRSHQQRPRTYQPVRRGSRERGERESRFWRPVDPLQLRAVQEAAKLEFRATKEPGKRNGSLGHVAREVLDFMVSTVEWATGELEPAYLYMAKALGRSKDAIWRALKELRDGGWIEWIRRSQAQPDGSTVQIENAYRILVPARWAKRVAMRVETWRRRNRAAGLRYRDHEAERAARAARRHEERLANGERRLGELIHDPDQRALAIAELRASADAAVETVPSPPNG